MYVNGYGDLIKLASNLSMNIEANSYVIINTLSTFTISTINKVIENNNIKTIKTFIKMAEEESNVVYHDAWFRILKLVLALDMLHILKSLNTAKHVSFSNRIVATLRQMYTHSFDCNNMNNVNYTTSNYNYNIVDGSYKAQVMNQYRHVNKKDKDCNDARFIIKVVSLDKIDCMFAEFVD